MDDYTGKWWERSYPEAAWPLFTDFKVFLRLAWTQLNLPAPTPVQLEIADYLQHGPRRKIIMAFRGVGKSWITSAFVCWLLLVDPQENILVVSASKERADQFTTFTMRLIAEMEELQHLYPRPEQRNSKIAFDVAPAEPDHAPSVKSVGVLGQMAGSRASRIVADDVEVPNNAETAVMRIKLSERVKEFDAILKPGGTIDYLGTPQTEESLYNKLPERGYEARIWPARYPTVEQGYAYGDRLAHSLRSGQPGSPTDPLRFDEIDLMEREASYGRSGFALQFQLDTRLSDALRYPLKLSDLIVMDLDPDLAPEKIIYGKDDALDDIPNVGFDGDRYYGPMDFARDAHGNVRRAPYNGSVLIIDPSGRGKDETAVIALKMLNSQIFLMEVKAFSDGYGDATLEAIAHMAARNKANFIQIEDNFGDGMFEALLKPALKRIYPCTTEGVKHHIQKEKRIIDTLEPVLNQHRLVVDRKLVQWDYDSTSDRIPEEANRYRLFYQLSRITKEKGSLVQDDRVDCLAIGVAYWIEHMSSNADDQMEEHSQALQDAELQRFMEHAQDPLGLREKAGFQRGNWIGKL